MSSASRMAGDDRFGVSRWPVLGWSASWEFPESREYHLFACDWHVGHSVLKGRSCVLFALLDSRAAFIR